MERVGNLCIRRVYKKRLNFDDAAKFCKKTFGGRLYEPRDFKVTGAYINFQKNP